MEVEQKLAGFLARFPRQFQYRYNGAAANALIQTLFHALINYDPDNLPLIFFNGIPDADLPRPWRLQDSQGHEEGAEYSEAARGHPCGHIFKSGEASYRCKTCTTDDTCALCARCFDASDHEGHTVYFSISPGNSGCCDCGDDEAWSRPMVCSIHSSDAPPVAVEKGKLSARPNVPADVAESIRATIGQALDYICDVFSCAPEQVKASATETSVIQDERLSRLNSRYVGSSEPDNEAEAEECEYALVVWHDEKHTAPDVSAQIARACGLNMQTAREMTATIEEVGRATVFYSVSLADLLRRARIIEAIGLTVTLRASRDVFREDMCGTIVEWIHDIIGCSVGNDGSILRNIACEELLSGWREGSFAHNAVVGRDGIEDHTRFSFRDQLVRHSAFFNTDGLLTIELDGGAEVLEVDVESEDLEDTVMFVRRRVLTDDSDDDLIPVRIPRRPRQTADIDVDDQTADAAAESADEEMGVPTPTTAAEPPAPTQPVAASNPSTPTPTPTPHAGLVHGPFSIPKTPRPINENVLPGAPADFWVTHPSKTAWNDMPMCENTQQRLRLDYLILFDIRMWKTLRISLRDILIGTVVTVPAFKRLLGLRFAGLYSVLAQLYLIADREPDLSVVNLSLQMLTSPSITGEMVRRKNFLSNLLAILYTFITNRQVGYPRDVDSNAILVLDHGTVANRRMYHFFIDLRYLLSSPQMHEIVKAHPPYLDQFLDLVKLSQGIYPTIRAVDEHVEYENDLWITVFTFTREINKSCRLFCDAFTYTGPEDLPAISAAIRTCGRAGIINSIGCEADRFEGHEVHSPVQFHEFPRYFFLPDDASTLRVVKYEVNADLISFHHPLHYMLSWVIERGKAISADDLRRLLTFTKQDLDKALSLTESSATIEAPELGAEEYLLALLDIPIRMAAWLAQMHAGMWVRNGTTLKQQMSSYCGSSQREIAYNRDIFLLQAALVVCDPTVVLASIIDRFGLADWVTGTYTGLTGRGDEKIVDVVEDFVHLLIIAFCDRVLLVPTAEGSGETMSVLLRRDITHSLCFKPLSYSEISSKVPEKFHDSSKFEDALLDVAVFRPPESVMDNGTYLLKPEMIEEVDPFVAQYNKNQREEAETLYKAHMGRKLGKSVDEVVLEPVLAAIQSGPFAGLGEFVHSTLFGEILFRLLVFSIDSSQYAPSVSSSRMESLLHFITHLLLVALRDDKSCESSGDSLTGRLCGFVFSARPEPAERKSILGVLFSLLDETAFKSCHPKIRRILQRMNEQWPTAYTAGCKQFDLPLADDAGLMKDQSEIEKEKRKQAARERHARIMAEFKQQQTTFIMSQQDWDDDDEEEDELSQDTDATVGRNRDQDVDMSSPDEVERRWKYPEDNCIMCQEKTGPDKVFGTFGFVTTTALFRQTDFSDPAWIGEVRDTPLQLDRSAASVRPFGVSGQNKSASASLKAGLSQGFPSATHCQTGHVMSGCGHIMHQACFSNYMGATRQRHFTQIARLHPERTALNEFVCPLCKALGNVFLPIIWRDKREVGVTALQPAAPFDQFIHSIGPGSAVWTSAGPGTAIALSSYASDLSEYTRADLDLTAVRPAPSDLTADVESPRSRSRAAVGTAITENYQSIEQTYKQSVSAHPPSTHPSSPYFRSVAGADSDFEFVHLLILTLGSTISSIEIAHRGVDSDGQATVAAKVAAQTTAMIRVLAETIVTVASIRPGVVKAVADKQTQLLAELAGAAEGPGSRFFPTRPVLSQDPFQFLVEASVFLVRLVRLEVVHVVRACLMAEILRAIISAVSASAAHKVDVSALGSDEKGELSAGEEEVLVAVAKVVVAPFFENSGLASDALDQFLRLNSRFIHTAVYTYAHVFLRKAALLLSLVHGVDFERDPVTNSKGSELDRLTGLLGLPRLMRLFGSEDGTVDPTSAALVKSWIDRIDKSGPVFHSFSSIRMGHPAIFELVGLPRMYDALIEETTKRKCPTTGRKLSDPAICLLCGEIMCSQATCCTKLQSTALPPTAGAGASAAASTASTTTSGGGGCYQHMARCGKSVGIFLNIRKCMVVMLHSKNGSWFMAPYLDKHSESDPTLRRQQQLFLNQNRYDVLLRTLWLNHAIPSTIARRLESEVNTGGWETL